MKSIAGAWALGLLGCIGAGLAHAQSAPSAASLEVIRAQLVRQGQINYTGTTHNSSTGRTWSNNFGVQASKVVVDAANCRIAYHWHTTVDGKVATDVDSAIPFARGTEVTLISMAEDVNQGLVKAGRTTEATSILPLVWVVHVMRDDGSRNTMDFRDQATAQTVVNAAKQAIKLCH